MRLSLVGESIGVAESVAFLDEGLISHACQFQAPRADQTRVWGYGVELSRYNQVTTSQSTCIYHASNCKCRSTPTNSWCRSVSTRCPCSYLQVAFVDPCPQVTGVDPYPHVVGYILKLSVYRYIFFALQFQAYFCLYHVIAFGSLSESCYNILCLCLCHIIAFRVFVYVML